MIQIKEFKIVKLLRHIGLHIYTAFTQSPRTRPRNSPTRITTRTLGPRAKIELVSVHWCVSPKILSESGDSERGRERWRGKQEGWVNIPGYKTRRRLLLRHARHATATDEATMRYAPTKEKWQRARERYRRSSRGSDAGWEGEGDTATRVQQRRLVARSANTRDASSQASSQKLELCAVCRSCSLPLFLMGVIPV